MTWAQFFAAARIIVEPPTSIISTEGRGLERVQVAHDEVDGGDVLGGKVLEMGLERAVGQDAGMDRRVQGLYAPSQHLGHPGDIGHFEWVDPGGLEGFGRAPARDELEAEGAQAAREILEPDLSYTERSARTREDATRAVSDIAPATFGGGVEERPSEGVLFVLQQAAVAISLARLD